MRAMAIGGLLLQTLATPASTQTFSCSVSSVDKVAIIKGSNTTAGRVTCDVICTYLLPDGTLYQCKALAVILAPGDSNKDVYKCDVAAGVQLTPGGRNVGCR
jgi:hypothetical protein